MHSLCECWNLHQVPICRTQPKPFSDLELPVICKSLPTSPWLTMTIVEVLWSCQAWSEAKEEAIQVSEAAAGSVIIGRLLEIGLRYKICWFWLNAVFHLFVFDWEVFSAAKREGYPWTSDEADLGSLDLWVTSEPCPQLVTQLYTPPSHPDPTLSAWKTLTVWWNDNDLVVHNVANI